MINITMDCRQLKTSKTARAYVTKMMTELRPCGDGTLYSLYDALIDPMQETAINFVNPPKSPSPENDYVERLLCVFLDAARTNPTLSVSIVHGN